MQVERHFLHLLPHRIYPGQFEKSIGKQALNRGEKQLFCFAALASPTRFAFVAGLCLLSCVRQKDQSARLAARLFDSDLVRWKLFLSLGNMFMARCLR
jgi:hypothetical protein